jgi:hypothetical protein
VDHGDGEGDREAGAELDFNASACTSMGANCFEAALDMVRARENKVDRTRCAKTLHDQHRTTPVAGLRFRVWTPFDAAEMLRMRHHPQSPQSTQSQRYVCTPHTIGVASFPASHRRSMRPFSAHHCCSDASMTGGDLFRGTQQTMRILSSAWARTCTINESCNPILAVSNRCR